jgi:TIR domain
MRAMSGPAGGIFISYRRGEASYIAGRLYDQLADRFGDDRVFIDVDNVELGIDFAKAVTQAVSTSEVLLAVIGPHWHTAIDADGNRRLDDPDDIVRLEIEVALQRDIRVIPILIDGAVMPRRGQLPESLGGLAHRNALVLRHESFRADVTRLMEAIDRVFRVTAVHVFGHPGRELGGVQPRRSSARHRRRRRNGADLGPGRASATSSGRPRGSGVGGCVQS